MREAPGRGAGTGAEASESGIGLSSLLVGGAPQRRHRTDYTAVAFPTRVRRWPRAVPRRQPKTPSPVTTTRLQSAEAASPVTLKEPKPELKSVFAVSSTELAWSAAMVANWQFFGTYW